MEISFCIPTYNRAKDLKRCLESVLINNDENIEVIVQDNCSPDHTKSTVDSYNDKRLKYFRNNSNIGIANNIITVIGNASGKYVFFLADDDYLLPGAVSVLKSFLRQNNPCFMTSHTKILLEKQNRKLDYNYFANSIDKDTEITKDTVANIIMSAHILTRVCFRLDMLDYDFLKKYGSDNWYPQMLIGLQMYLKGPILYLAEALTAHIWENETYWGISPDDRKTLNQGFANIIKAIGPYLDEEMLERMLIVFFNKLNCYFEELTSLLSVKKQVELRAKYKNQEL